MTTDLPETSSTPAYAYEANFVPAMFLPWSEELLTRASPRPNDRVLDVACGTGIVARQVAPLVGVGGAVTGLDISPQMLEVARSLPLSSGVTIEWREGSAEELPFEEASFDLVLCQQGLQFVPDKLAAAREMRRVLSPGGRAVVAVWRGLEHQPVFVILEPAMNRRLGQGPGAPFAFGDADLLRALFDDAGFGDVALDSVIRKVHFPSADGFVRMVVMSAAAVIPELAELDDAARQVLIDVVGGDVDGQFDPYCEGEGLTFPMCAHVVVATR